MKKCKALLKNAAALATAAVLAVGYIQPFYVYADTTDGEEVTATEAAVESESSAADKEVVKEVPPEATASPVTEKEALSGEEKIKVPAASTSAPVTETEEKAETPAVEKKTEIPAEPTVAPVTETEEKAEASAAESDSKESASPAPEPAGEEKAEAEKDNIPAYSDSVKEETPAETEPTEMPAILTYSAPVMKARSANALANANDDVTKPVFESFEFDENGQALKTGDVLNVRMNAYDLESGIKSATVYFNTNQSTYAFEIPMTYSGQGNLYTGTYELGKMINGEYYVSSWKIIDNNNNYVEQTYSSDQKYTYWFSYSSDLTYKVSSISFDANGSTFEKADFADTDSSKFGLTVITEEEYDDYMFAEFKSDSGVLTLTMYRNADNPKEYSVLSGANIGVPGNSGENSFVLNRIYVSMRGGWQDLSYDGSLSDFGFKVNLKEEDTSVSVGKVNITGIDFTHNGEFVTAGDKIEITVHFEVEGNDPYTNGAYANIYAAEDIDQGFESVKLAYNPENHTYSGEWIIPEDCYSCEWYLQGVTFYGNGFAVSDSIDGYVYYVNVKTGSTFVETAGNLNVYVHMYDTRGYQLAADYSIENVGRRFTLREIGISLDETGQTVKGFRQTGWIDKFGNPVTEDTVLLNTGYLYIYPSFDKIPVSVSFKYAGNDGEIKELQEIIMVDKGSTYGDLYDQIDAYRPSDRTEEYEIGEWSYAKSDADVNAVLPLPYSMLYSATAVYPDKVMLPVNKTYFEQDGLEAVYSTDKQWYFMADPDMTYGDVAEELKKLPQPENMPEGLQFDSWDVYSYTDMDQSVTEISFPISMTALYKNCYAQLLVITRGTNLGSAIGNPSKILYRKYFVLDAGSVLTIPKEISGLKNLKWEIGGNGTDISEGGEVVLEGGRAGYLFVGVAEADDQSVTEGSGETAEPDQDVTSGSEETEGTENHVTGGSQEPTEPDRVPTDGPGYSDEDDAGTRPDETAAVQAVKEITDAAEGETVVISMGDATVVTKEMLAAAKGRNVTIVLDMGGYTWTINGKDIKAADLKDINLEVTLDTNAIPNGIIKELAGDNPVRQLSLTHNGDFGFLATLTVNLGSEYAGSYGNLYYYSSDGRMIFMDAGKIAADGSVSLDFSHASDYAIVITDEPMTKSSGSGKDVQSGVTDTAAPYIALIGACIAAGVFFFRKRQERI